MKKDIISRNISLLMEHFDVRNESQLAKLVGMPQTTINKLLTGVSADPRISTLTPIVEHFKITLDTLLSDNPVFISPPNRQQLDTLIPIITYEELSDIYDNLQSLKIENWPQWYPIPKQSTSDYYAVHINQKQFPQPFYEASILIVKNEPKLPRTGYCLVKHLDSNTVNIKKTFLDNGKQWLLALEAGLPTSEFDMEHWQTLGIIQAFVIDISNGDFIYLGEQRGRKDE